MKYLKKKNNEHYKMLFVKKLFYFITHLGTNVSWFKNSDVFKLS